MYKFMKTLMFSKSIRFGTRQISPGDGQVLPVMEA
jgi:hypothetical protein